MLSRAALPSLSLALLSFAPTALGQESKGDPVSSAALAEALFQEAKQLMGKGEYAAACPKLAESQRLDPTGGTLLNLALCHEQAGQLALAWAEYKQALAQAIREQRPKRVKFAERRIADLDRRLPRLSLQLTDGPRLEGFRLEVDGVELGSAVLDSAVPLNPGDHEVVASAPGYVSWRKNLELKEGDRLTLRVPSLEPDRQSPAAPPPGAPVATPHPAPPPPAPFPPPDEPTTSGPDAGPDAGPLLLVAGSALLVAGALVGWRALELRARSDDRCPQERCDRKGVRLNDEAQAWAWGANITLALGVVGVGAGAYLTWWPTARPTTTPAPGVRVGGRW